MCNRHPVNGWVIAAALTLLVILTALICMEIPKAIEMEQKRIYQIDMLGEAQRIEVMDRQLESQVERDYREYVAKGCQ